MISSVMNQSFQDFELIIVNDGSTDNTRQILDDINENRIRIIHSDHKGPSISRNIAISNARAEIIFNLDADDKIEYDLLGKAYNVFQEERNAGIVYTECRFFGAKKGIMKLGPYSLEKMLGANRIVSAAFFRKGDWMLCGGYSESFVYGLEDWDLWLGIIEIGRDVIKIPDSCFYYRIYPGPAYSRSGKRNSDRTKALNAILLIYKRHSRLYSGFPELLERSERYEKENNSVLKKRIKNLVFPVKYKLSCLVN